MPKASPSTPARTSSPTASRPRPASTTSCRVVEHYGETVWVHGLSYDYPAGLLKVPRYVVSALRRSREAADGSGDVRRRPVPPSSTAARSPTRSRCPLRRGVVGRAGHGARHRPSPTRSRVASRRRSALKLAARLTHRAVAIGYGREAPQSANVWHVYPEHGISTRVRAASPRSVADSIRLAEPGRVHHRQRRPARCGVRVAGQQVPAAAVVSTAPINVLPRLVDGTDALEPFRRVPVPADGVRQPASPRPRPDPRHDDVDPRGEVPVLPLHRDAEVDAVARARGQDR